MKCENCGTSENVDIYINPWTLEIEDREETIALCYDCYLSMKGDI